jgi:hypothetical protein
MSTPTLIIYRSAEALRDAGIRYAYMKAGMIASMGVFVLAGAGAIWLLLENTQQFVAWSWLLLVIELATAVAATLFGRAAKFPHCARMTLEELDTPQTGMLELATENRNQESELDWPKNRLKEALQASAEPNTPQQKNDR